jgi:hypothetical protein
MCVGNGEGLLSRCGDVSEPHVRAEKGRSLVGGAAWASPLSALLAPGQAFVGAREENGNCFSIEISVSIADERRPL